MRPIELLRLVKNNLLRMRIRVLMTSAGVFIGTTAVILLVSLGAGLQRAIVSSFGDVADLTEIQVSPPGIAFFGPTAVNTQSSSDLIINDRTISDFRDLPGVTAATPVLSLQANAMLRLNRLTAFPNMQGVDPLELSRFDLKLDSGSSALGPWHILVGSSIASNFFNERTGENDPNLNLQGQTLQLILSKNVSNSSGQLETVERTVRLRVVGVLAESGGQKDFSIFMPIRNLEDLNAWANGRRTNYNREGYSQALVKVATPDQAEAVESQIQQQGFNVFSFRTILQQVNTTFLILQAVVGGIGAIALLVAAFGIANTMIMAIYERTREIGLMKAVGATNRDVMTIFLAEAGFIGLIGGVGGIIAGVGLGQILGLIGREFLRSQIAQQGGAADTAPIPVYTPLWLPVFALVFATLIGVISGIYPALRAVRLDPIAALRYE